MSTSRCKIVAVTEPLIDTLDTPEDFIAYTARVSNPTNQGNNDTAPKLLKYLAKHAHWSPFEMVHVVMEINTTRDIARQILRHRSFSFQEFSQRYADVGELGDMFEQRELRFQDPKNRQNSITPDPKGNYRLVEQEWERTQKVLMEDIPKQYKKLLENGVAKEQARAILPEGLTKSRLYMSGTLRSWIHYCDLRMGNGTQKEHMDIAKECWEIILEGFPSLAEVLSNGEEE